MMIKEKSAENKIPEKARERGSVNAPPLVNIALCIAAGILFGGEFGASGKIAGIPLCAPLISVLEPFFGACVFIGSAASYIAGGNIGSFLSEIIAMPALLIVKMLPFKIKRPAANAVLAGAVYFIAGVTASFASRITGTLIAALFFRGVICAAAAYFMSEAAESIRKSGRICVSGEKAVGTAVLYVLFSAALCSFRIGNFSPARTAGIFIILAAGGRAGAGAAAAAGALMSLSVILGESRGSDLSDMVRGSAVLCCSGLISASFSKRSRTASSAAFSVSALILTLFMGKISSAAFIMTDTLIAAALYSLVPDRLYMRLLSFAEKRSSSAEKCFSMTVSMAADAVKEIGESVTKAAEILAEINGGDEYELSSEICGGVCKKCRNDTFCCKGSVYRGKYIFPEALRVFKAKGHIDEKELPKALEGCSKKSELAMALNKAGEAAAEDSRKKGFAAELRENMSEQLCTVSAVLSDMSGELCKDRTYDAALSEKVGLIIEAAGAKEPCAAVFFDKAGRVFISCFYKNKLERDVSAVTENLSRLFDREMEPPEAFSENGVTRLRWHEAPDFVIESGTASMNGKEDISGDSFTEFADGTGSVYYIISDGMGSGGRAALESSMTVSMLSRLIRSGTSAAAAVRLVNLILLSKSGDEVFSTVDILKIDLFTGKAEMIKSGAALTFFRNGGSVKAVESRTLPAGMLCPAQIERKTLYLSDGDCAVMISDGIREKSYPKIRELILTEGYTPQKYADEIIAYDSAEENSPADDRTVIVVKLHKI